MDINLLFFFVSLAIEVIICVFLAIIRQHLIEKKTLSSNSMKKADNHIMKTEQYSGKYSICSEIGEADAEF